VTLNPSGREGSVGPGFVTRRESRGPQPAPKLRAETRHILKSSVRQPVTPRHMTPRSHDASADAVGLGALLVLLHGADAPVETVEVTYRLWRHRQRAHAAFVADAEEQKPRGASIAPYGLGEAQPEPAESEETVRIWRAGERARSSNALAAARWRHDASRGAGISHHN
jgi:hypothetical protein